MIDSAQTLRRVPAGLQAIRKMIMRFSMKLLVCLYASTAMGGLVVNVTGLSGGTTSTWVFSGSATVTGSGTTGTSNVPWIGGQFVSGNHNNVTANSGLVTVTGTAVAGASITADEITLSNSNGGDGVSVTGNLLNQAFTAGEVSWSGTLVIPISIDELNEGNFTNLAAETKTNDQAFTGTTLDLIIAKSTAVPEPATLGIMSLVAVCAGAARWRRMNSNSGK